MVLTVKKCPRGFTKSFKARLVARGDQQHSQSETYAPVSVLITFRALIIKFIIIGGCLSQADAKQAFLQALIPDGMIIYVQPPKGVAELLGLPKEYESMVWELDKALYGLDNAPRLWYNLLRGTLHEFGYKTDEANQGMYVNRDRTIIASSHVDDLIVWTADEEMMNQFKQQTKDRLKLTFNTVSDYLS